ncbi:potassium/sodium hyperpolarization-activated cyclic nucleotide-gated channel 4-like [Ctenocephalides felis]|uniref:potassium/sodium hyperpolarization-activated cyclic nucleotide-gated channel 4-like n=1 Tax=Ctenocephalides felis TaxID=7515 RepID=UPI000E6E53AD|nr:potassium/sodium hyperpolarization-activated cyclic nucleotide-gated channel 4-like [Ctenocephalides felis]
MSNTNVFHIHNCSIFNRRDALDRVIPGNGLIPQLRRRFRNYCMVCPDFPASRANLKSERAVHMERRRHLHQYYYVFHPFSKFRMLFEGIMILLLSLQILIVPYVISFYPKHEHSLVNNFAMLLCFFVDMASIIDIMCSLNTGYFCTSNKEIVLDRKRIIINYFKGYLIFNIVSSAPLELLFHLSYETSHSLNSFIIFGLLKFFHIITLVTYMKNFQVCYYTSSYTSRFLRQCFALFVILHWLACLKFMITRWTHGDVEDLIPTFAWVKQMNFLPKFPNDRYITCFFNIMSASTTYNYGMSLSFSSEDMIMTMVLYLFGSILKILVVAQILLLVRNTNASKLKYQTLLQQLNEFIRHKQLPQVIRNRLLDYYEFKFQKNFYKEDAILDTLSTQLRQEIIVYSCRRLVTSVPFFEKIPNTLLVRIVTCLQSEIYLAQDYIIKAGEPGNCMYFINCGTVAIYGASLIEKNHLYDGDYFGEVSLVTGEVRIASVVAIETCELYTLSRQHFMEVMGPYPHLFEKIKDTALIRANIKMAVKKWLSFRKSDT